MSPITTHVLDTALGRPALGVLVRLELQLKDQSWKFLAEGVTNEDGRVANLLGDEDQLTQGVYRINFDTKTYFQKKNVKYFYPEVNITFDIENPREHFHVPLLISGFGYSTYRGS